MIDPILDQIPKEYRRVYQELPDNELESFQHSLNVADKSQHHYLYILEAITRTFNIYTSASPVWLYLYSRISFIGTRYDDLLKFWEDPKYNGNPIVAPFVGRVLAFQNKYEDAISICLAALEKMDLEITLNLIEIYTYYELNFTLGLAYSYTRQFEKADKIIANLEAFSAKYYVKKTITQDYFLDVVYIEYIIRGYASFFRGQPKEMGEALQTINSWVDNLNDPWLKGFYYNIYGISKIMAQDLAGGEDALKMAFKAFEKCHDMRGYTTVGGNLSMSLITKGERLEGRKYLESVIKPQIRLKNYWLAVGNMLTVTKTYVDEKNYDEAKRMLQWAEESAIKGSISEPAIFSMFAFYFSKVGDLEKANDYLMRLKQLTEKPEGEEADNYTLLYYYEADAINAMINGDLNNAQKSIVKGIELADTSGYFNYALELSTIYLEVIFKKYLIDHKKDTLFASLDIIRDLTPLIEMTQNPFFETLFLIMVSYVSLAMGKDQEAMETFDKASEKAFSYEESAQYAEIALFEERQSFINTAHGNQGETSSQFAMFMDNWLSKEYLSTFYILEAIRLLSNLQFEKTSLGQQQGEEKQPVMLFIVGQGGITQFTHKFKESGDIDEVLVGGFLSALTTFSQELFGGGMLTRIDQENHVLLMEKISASSILVLIVDEETYLIRKKFKKFSSELSRMRVIDYLEDMVLTEYDPQYQIIEGLIEIIFTGIDPEK